MIKSKDDHSGLEEPVDEEQDDLSGLEESVEEEQG